MLAITTAARIDQQRGRVTVLQQILGDKGGKVTLNLLKKHHGFAQEEVEAIADAFPDLLAIDIVEPGESGGRPSRILRLASLGR